MKEKFKKIIKSTKLWQYSYCLKINSVYLNKTTKLNKTKRIFKALSSTKPVFLGAEENKISQLKELFNRVNYDNKINNRFYYSLDPNAIMYTNSLVIGNIPIDYKKVVGFSLDELRSMKCNDSVPEIMRRQNNDLLDLVEHVICDIIYKMKVSNNPNSKKIISWFERMKTERAKTLEEALQRILFWNQLMWQTKHTLNGLGRLDQILIDVCEKSNHTDFEIVDILKDFLQTLHFYYEFKSNELMGDTGQVIIIGGTDMSGNYQANRLTYSFIDAVKELNLPDPKLVLRVSSNTPADLIEASLKCIATGIGCPIFANDDVIIPKLIDFGYDKEDAYDFVTSACWEPSIPGKSSEQNNLIDINFINPLNDTLLDDKITLAKDMNSFINIYKSHIKKELDEIILKLNTIKYEPDPILSLLVDKCSIEGKDIANGGAKYNNYGLLTVGVSNAINSLINIKKYVYNSKKFTLEQLRDWQEQNFEAKNEIQDLFKNETLKFGCDDQLVLNLTSELMSFVEDNLKDYRNKYGGKAKFGFSSPAYLNAAVNSKASFDGRYAGQPFNTHISNPQGVPYTELVSFAGKLDYSGSKFNGNVVDFIVSPSFINNNFNKFVEFIKSSIDVGFFEMQMNVVSYETLVNAKAHPEDYKRLIVRVWGFSSYFNDLPEEYKDLLIKRAKESELIA